MFEDRLRDLNSCGAKEITRTWRVLGTNVRCDQRILLEAADPFAPSAHGDCYAGQITGLNQYHRKYREGD